MATNRP